MATISDGEARTILDRPWVVRPQEWESRTAHNTVRGGDRSWQVALKTNVREVEGSTIVTVYHPWIAEEIASLHNEALLARVAANLHHENLDV